MTDTDPYTDVVELCALLQCLGFNIKSLETIDSNNSQGGGCRTVDINCQLSGLHVVLESVSLSCSCPLNNPQNSGIWQVSGVTGGKKLKNEFGCSLLGSLPKSHRERLSRELHEMIRCIKQSNESDVKERDVITNISSSMVELNTPEKMHQEIKLDTPTRYRSLDTLTKIVKDDKRTILPIPKLLQRTRQDSEFFTDDDIASEKKRQSTYTIASTPGSIRRRNKTSSPIMHVSQRNILEDLLTAEKSANQLSKFLAKIVREFTKENKHDSSESLLTLDVSKISVMKGVESSKPEFASSPNLLENAQRSDNLKNKLKRTGSASTSNLDRNRFAPNKEAKPSCLGRVSPRFLNIKKFGQSLKDFRSPAQDNKSGKLSGLIKPKTITTPVGTSSYSKSSPNLSSSSRKKFSHVKSTIPRPAKKEETRNSEVGIQK